MSKPILCSAVATAALLLAAQAEASSFVFLGNLGGPPLGRHVEVTQVSTTCGTPGFPCPQVDTDAGASGKDKAPPEKDPCGDPGHPCLVVPHGADNTTDGCGPAGHPCPEINPK